MPSVLNDDDKGTEAEGDDPSDPFHPMTMHVYPFPNALAPNQQPMVRAKRRQVKNACTNCQKACKKCDDARPCLRCVKYGISDECVDSQRKERRRGVKRGPYKKRDGKGSSVDQDDVPDQHQAEVASNVVDPQCEQPFAGPYYPVGYPPGYYTQYTQVQHSKPAETPPPAVSMPLYTTSPPQPYFLAPIQHVHPQLHHVAEPDNIHPYSPQGFYQATVLTPMTAYHPHYPIPRHDNPPDHLSDQYPLYGVAVFPKPHLTGQPDVATAQRNDRAGLLVNGKEA